MASVLKNLLIEEKTTEVDYPSMAGFKVKVNYLSRDKLMKLRDKATTPKLNRRTRQMEDSVDDNYFQELYIDAVIKGWSGFKYGYLKKLMLVDIAEADEDKELEYSPEEARLVMKNSADFDSFISNVISDLGNF